MANAPVPAPRGAIATAFLVLAVVLLAIILVADLARVPLPPEQTAWWAGAGLSYVVSRLPWWP